MDTEALAWTPHGYKHFASTTRPWAEIIRMSVTKFSDTIDFSPGQVVYEFSLTEGKEWVGQLDDLDEDLLQVTFARQRAVRYWLVPGTYPKGQFQVRVIRDLAWDSPLFYAKVSTLGVLHAVVEATKHTAVEAALVAA